MNSWTPSGIYIPMANVTIQELVDELNLVAEYAAVEMEFEVKDPQTVTAQGRDFVVDPSWAMGNVKRLPDRTNTAQMVEALEVSHPDRKGVGPKLPPKG